MAKKKLKTLADRLKEAEEAVARGDASPFWVDSVTKREFYLLPNKGGFQVPVQKDSGLAAQLYRYRQVKDAGFGIHISSPSGGVFYKPNLDRDKKPSASATPSFAASLSPSYSPSLSVSPSPSPEPTDNDCQDGFVMLNGKCQPKWAPAWEEENPILFNPEDLVDPITRTEPKKSQSIASFIVKVYLWIRNLL